MMSFERRRIALPTTHPTPLQAPPVECHLGNVKTEPGTEGPPVKLEPPESPEKGRLASSPPAQPDGKKRKRSRGNPGTRSETKRSSLVRA